MNDNQIDEELRRRMRQNVSTRSTTSNDLRTLRPRFERARRRRMAATAAGSVSAVTLVVVGALSLGGGSPDQRVVVADSTPRSSVVTQPSTTVAPTSTVSSSVPSTTVSKDGADPTTSVTSLPAVTTTVVGATGEPGASPGPTETTVPDVSPDTTNATTTTMKPVGGTRVLTSAGGTATVVWTATSLTVQRTDPASGWRLEQVEQKTPTRVVIKFTRDGGSGTSSATIDARVENGTLKIS